MLTLPSKHLIKSHRFLCCRESLLLLVVLVEMFPNYLGIRSIQHHQSLLTQTMQRLCQFLSAGRSRATAKSRHKLILEAGRNSRNLLPKVAIRISALWEFPRWRTPWRPLKQGSRKGKAGGRYCMSGPRMGLAF